MAPDTFTLAGKAALITGSGRENGIGGAIARAFARNGAAVALHHVSEGSKSKAESLAADLAREFGVKTAVVQGPVEEFDTAKRIVEESLKGLGVDHIDILVNNAGAGDHTTLLQATPEQIQRDFGINTFSTIYMTQAVVGAGKMPRGGRVINIGSIVSKMGIEVSAVYAAAKAAQDSLTASWAGELGHSHGITVNTLAPGPIPTDTSKKFLEEEDGSPSDIQKDFFGKTRAAARLGTVEDMADSALLLASDKSRWITAQWISVSGGITGTM